MEQNISRFQIPMQNILGIKGLKSAPDLAKYLNRLLLCQPLLGLDILGQCPPVTELVHQVIIIGRPQHFDELDDVGVVDFA
jgi:hypothetical protein